MVKTVLLNAARMVERPSDVDIYIGYGSGVIDSSFYNNDGSPVHEHRSTAEPWTAIAVAADKVIPRCANNAGWAQRELRETRYGALMHPAQKAFRKALDKAAGLEKPYPAPGASRKAIDGDPSAWEAYVLAKEGYYTAQEKYIEGLSLHQRADLIREAIKFVASARR